MTTATAIVGKSDRGKTARELAALVRTQFTRYVVFHRDYADAEADTLTLWTMHTHAFEAAEATPYLAVMAPTPEAGKSRIIDVAQHLVRRGKVVHDPTPSSLFRMIDNLSPTLFIDEVDVLYASKPLQAVLNAGYRFGSSIPRTETVHGERQVVEYDVFCPKLFAGIAGQRLPIRGATLSRCVILPMQRKARNEQAERFYHRHGRQQGDTIQRVLAKWAEGVGASLATAEPEIPAKLSDRQAECWEPLFAIADHLGGEWPERARCAAVSLAGQAMSAPDDGSQILADLKAVWDQIVGQRCHTVKLAAGRNALEDRHYAADLSAHELSVWLARFGIHPHPNAFRLDGKQARGYSRSAFDDAFRRYVL